MESEQPMKTYLTVLAGLILAISATAAEPAWWTQQKIDCGLPASLAYNDWVAQGSPCNRGNTSSSTATTPTAPVAAGHEFDSTINQAVSAGLSGKISGGDAVGFVGLGILGNALFAPNTVDPAEQQRQQELQQRQLAAKQLYNSGLWYLRQKNYAGAIIEFQKALEKTPDDQNIINSLALAKQKIKDTKVAAQNSGALQQLLGDAPADAGNFNFNQLAGANPNASALSLVDLNPKIDPALLKNDAAPPVIAPDVQRTVKELDKLLNGDTDQVKQQLENLLNGNLKSGEANAVTISDKAYDPNEFFPHEKNIVARSAASNMAAEARVHEALEQYKMAHGGAEPNYSSDEWVRTRARADKGIGYSNEELKAQIQKALVEWHKRHDGDPPVDKINGSVIELEVILGGKG